MKVSISWLKELVDLNTSIDELIKLLPLRTIGLKEVNPNYIELDMKGYNRADLLSLRGVAYEIAAITDSQVKFSEEESFFWQNGNLPKAKVEVKNTTLAPVYCIAKIENLKVEHSSDAWVNKLNESGIRTVNNVADITNLVMVEFGQPMHAFDAQKVKDGKIIVRTAKEGEELQTLDEKVRKLTPDDLLITDPEKALGLAGVMGGKNSEVSNQTNTILLEAAIFDPLTLRKTATKLGLISEASKRFYHGLTKKRLFQALEAAIKMYESIGGKLTALTIVDSSEKNNPVTIDLAQKKITSLIGVEITSKQVEQYLTSLKFQLASHSSSGNVVKVTPPYFRLDINIEEDLIEEVARMYGYEKIPAKPISNIMPSDAKNTIFGLLESLKQALFKAGLTEVQTYSYYSTKVIENGELKMENLIRLANPISAETEYLRKDLWPNLLEAAAKNIRNGTCDVAIFEIGKVYFEQDRNPQEQYRLAIALADNSGNPIASLYQLFLKTPTSFKTGINFRKEKAGEIEEKHFHPTRFSSIYHKNENVGGIAEVHPRIVNQFGVEQKIAVLEIDLSKLL